MSEYRKSTTNCKDIECLIDALVEMGYAKENIEVHKEAQQLFDFQGRPTHYTDRNGDKANVIVRRQHVGGAANDLGFKLNPETLTYDAIISQYDSSKHNSTWLAGLKTNYSEKNLIKTAKKQGFKYLGKKIVSGKIQLQWLDTRSV
jgi:hypothetical protein